MKTYRLQITLKSNSIIGSGEGFGAIIDSDTVFDENGLPYLPARRLKGCMRDASKRVVDMLHLSNSKFLAKFSLSHELVKQVYGLPGQKFSTRTYFQNLYLQDHEKTSAWLDYFKQAGRWNGLVNADAVLQTFTKIRQQTALGEDGVALPHSLRTIRTLKKGCLFVGEIESDVVGAGEMLALSCAHLRYMGSQRNRGFGLVECVLYENDNNLTKSILQELEKCMQ